MLYCINMNENVLLGKLFQIIIKLQYLNILNCILDFECIGLITIYDMCYLIFLLFVPKYTILNTQIAVIIKRER